MLNNLTQNLSHMAEMCDRCYSIDLGVLSCNETLWNTKYTFQQSGNAKESVKVGFKSNLKIAEKTISEHGWSAIIQHS